MANLEETGAMIATALPGEFLDILKGNLKPTPHAGDAV